MLWTTVLTPLLVALTCAETVNETLNATKKEAVDGAGNVSFELNHLVPESNLSNAEAAEGATAGPKKLLRSRTPKYDSFYADAKCGAECAAHGHRGGSWACFGRKCHCSRSKSIMFGRGCSRSDDASCEALCKGRRYWSCDDQRQCYCGNQPFVSIRQWCR
mmetsp:Transcript_62825/g.99589  ORF Transcript_62825/g.99589 Transcript_62825/m.99589 type:complete len:161 (+) Transcript_62825:80-562(+)